MKRVWNCLALAACLSSVAAEARADVKLPKIFGDHMVLQQQSDVAVWGWADAGEEVSVSLGAASAKTKAGADGKWTTKIRTPAAGAGAELVVQGKNKITVADVLIGEVWICSGQSNMEWSVAASLNPQEEAKVAEYPQIRMFKVKKNVADKPLEDCDGAWIVCSPQTVSGFSAVGYYFGRHLHRETKLPVGLINTSWGGTICEAWTSNPALAAVEDLKYLADKPVKIDPAKMNPNQPSVLYNAMIQPIVPFGVKGAIWYQGESNRGRAAQYRTLFPTMIRDWRQQFGQGDIAFHFVQLAPYRYNNGKNNVDPSELAEIWESQTATLSLPNTGMCVTTDIGNVNDIHPKNKQEVGRRLALWALAKNYGQASLEHSGPLYDSMTVEDGKIRLKFRHVGGGLVAEGGKPLSHFTIAGDDQKFVEATATIEGDTVVVQSPSTPKPVAVRFAWNELAEPNFFNKAGLPASPFRTDKFKLVTEGRQ